jgi:hypothetical protein
MVSQRNTNMAIASTIVPFPDMIACSLSEFWLFLCSEQDCELQARKSQRKISPIISRAAIQIDPIVVKDDSARTQAVPKSNSNIFT